MANMVNLKAILPILAVFLLILIMPKMPNATSSGTLNASVLIYCPFYINISLSKVYILSSNMPLTYAVNTTAQCTIAHISGELFIWNSSSSISNPTFTYPISLYGLTNSPSMYYITLNGNFIKPASYYASIVLNGAYYKESTNGPRTFEVINYTNIKIANVSVSQSLPESSILSITDNIINLGGITSNANTTLNVKIIGPNGYSNISKYSIGAIASGGGIVSTISFYNSTNAQGTYTIVQNVTYSYNYTIEGKKYVSGNFISKTVISNYTVTQNAPSSHSSQSSAPKSTSSPPTSIGSVSYLSTPYSISLIDGESTMYPLTLYNHNTNPVWINLTVPKINNLSISLSSYNLYLLPSQSVSINMLFGSDPGNYMESAFVPIYENITAQHQLPISYTQYIGVSISNKSPSKLVVLNNIISVNDSSEVDGSIKLYNPTTRNITNASASIQLPSVVTNNKGDISLSGAQGIVELTNGKYSLKWYGLNLPSNSTATLYYNVKNVSNQAAFDSYPVSFEVPTSSGGGALKIFNIGIPTAYTNQSSAINITALYSGTTAGNVTFRLSGPPSIGIKQNTLRLNVSPNAILTPVFNISGPASGGTYIMSLYVYGNQINSTYTFDLIVLPQQQLQQKVAQQPQYISQPSIQKPPIGNNSLYGIYASLVLAIVFFSIITIRYKRLERLSYSEPRAARLKDLRDHIKRGE